MTARLFSVVLLLLTSVPALAAQAVVDWEHGFVNARAEPSHGSKKTGTIQKGVKVEILSQKDEWAKVRHPGGDGWVVLKSLRVLPDKAASKPAQAKAPEPVVQQAPAEEKTPEQRPAEPPKPPAPAPDPAAAARPPSGYLSDVPETRQLPEVSLGKTLLSMISGLLVVMGLIGAVVWAIRRFMGKNFPGMKGGSAIRLLASKPLGPRQAVLLIEVGGEVYLLGQTESEINLISKIESEGAIDRLDFLFTFKPTKFESELRRELNVDEVPEGMGDAREEGGEDRPLSVAERLNKLRNKLGKGQ